MKKRMTKEQCIKKFHRDRKAAIKASANLTAKELRQDLKLKRKS